MKKIFSTLLLLLLSAVVFAQVKVTFYDNPDITVQFKRCIATGNTAYIDFLLTNDTGKDLRAYVIEDDGGQYKSTAYDDEGTVYSGYDDGYPDNRLYSLTLAGEYFIVGWTPDAVTIPSGVPVKGRIEIKDLDEYATMFNLVKIAFRGMSNSLYGKALLEFKNVPITRQ